MEEKSAAMFTGSTSEASWQIFLIRFILIRFRAELIVITLGLEILLYVVRGDN